MLQDHQGDVRIPDVTGGLKHRSATEPPLKIPATPVPVQVPDGNS